MKFSVLFKMFFIMAAAGLISKVAITYAADDQSSDVISRGKIIYEAHCISCHGAQGRGDGASAHALIPKPKDFTDPSVKYFLTEDRIADVVVKGKAGTQMEGAGNKFSPEDVKAVAMYIRLLR